MEQYFRINSLVHLCVCALLLVEVNGDCSLNEECVSIRSCPALFNVLLQSPLPPSEVTRLQKAQCGYDYSINQPRVCCTKTTEKPPETNLLPKADVCGQDPNKRIVGGQLTDLRQFPWLALLEYDKPTGRGFHCGGSLINENYVITAAHCIRRIPRTWRLISIRLGEHQIDTDPDCDDDDKPGFEDCADSPIDVPVSEITVHTQYGQNQLGQPNDIALVRLSKPVSYTRSISPICLPTTPEFLNNRFTGVSMTVSGWGRTENSSKSNTKLKLEIPINSESECSALYKQNGVTLTDSQVCAGGQKGKDSCSGDSGGPLMYLHKTATEYNWYLYGIVSFGPIECGTKDFPGIYTLVPKHLSWIINNIRE